MWCSHGEVRFSSLQALPELPPILDREGRSSRTDIFLSRVSVSRL